MIKVRVHMENSYYENVKLKSFWSEERVNE